MFHHFGHNVIKLVKPLTIGKYTFLKNYNRYLIYNVIHPRNSFKPNQGKI